MKIADVRKLTPLEVFLYWIRERFAIYQRGQAGCLKPWTDDEILQNYRFTNPYRELDKTTAWFRTMVRDPLRDDPAVVLATTIVRWFNFIPTGEVLMGGSSNLLLDWSEEEALARLRPIHDAGGQVFVFFILTVAAAESAIGLAILVVLFRNRMTINVGELDKLKG